MKEDQKNLNNTQLFTELFRPKTLKDAILVPRVRDEVEKGLRNSPLFYGKPGCGKTTLTRILAAPYDTLEINASLERGIDTIREKVISFSSSASLFDDGKRKFKVIILEEMDGLTNDSQNSLRATMEKYYKNVRFIGNCNYIDKLQDPLLSRFNVIPLEPINKDEENYLFSEYVKRAEMILNYLGIAYTDESIKTFIKNNFPDLRSIIKKIQQLYTRGAKELTPDMLSASFDCSDLFKMIMNKCQPWDNYKYLIGEWSSKPEDAILQIGEQFPEYLHTAAPQLDAKIPYIIVAIAEHQNMLPTAIDKFIVLESLVFRLQNIINQ